MAKHVKRRFFRQPGPSKIASRRQRLQIVVFRAESLETRRLLSAFTLDPIQSSITINGTVDGIPLTAQSVGSLTDTYSGTVQLSVLGSTVDVSSPSTITAESSGTAQPGGTAANYAIAVAGEDFAVRGLMFDLTADIAIPNGNGDFTGSGSVTIPSGAEIATPLGAVPLSGTFSSDAIANPDGSVATSGSTTIVMLPIDQNLTQTVDGFALDLDFDGELVMSASTTVTASVSGTTLTVNGTPGPDNIAISANSGNIVVDDDGQLVDTFPASSVSDVLVFGGLGADTITIGSGVPATNASGNYGADTITAANSAPDTLGGGKGKDSLDASTSTGDDLLEGGMGPDTLLAGAGNDSLFGNAGLDSVVGGSGANSLAGGLGDDTIVGGSGLESLDGGAGVNKVTLGPSDIQIGAPLLNVDFTVNGSPVQVGEGEVGNSTSDYWNDINNSELVNSGANGVDSGADSGLYYSDGALAQGISLNYHADGSFDTTTGGPFANQPALANLMRSFLISYGTGANEGYVQFQGLTTGNTYDVYLYSSGNYQGDGRESVFSVNGAPTQTATFETDTTLTDNVNYVEIPATVVDGSIVITFEQGAVGGEADLNGIQLLPT